MLNNLIQIILEFISLTLIMGDIVGILRFINYFFDKPTINRVYSLHITNFFGFRSEVSMKYYLEELITKYLPSITNKSIHISITFIDCKVIESKYHLLTHISKECVFHFDVNHPISVNDLYNLIEWNELAFSLENKNNDLIMFIKIL